MELQALSWKITAHAVTSSQIAFYLYIPLHSRQAGIPPSPSINYTHTSSPLAYAIAVKSKELAMDGTSKFLYGSLKGKKGTLREKSAHCHKQ